MTILTAERALEMVHQISLGSVQQAVGVAVDFPTSILWAEVRRKAKKQEGQVQVSELVVEEMCSPAVLDFLRSTGVGRAVPREDGEDDEEDRTGRAIRLGRRIRKMCDVLSALLSALLLPGG